VPLYIYIYIAMVTANSYMFRPLTGHHQVVHPMKKGCSPQIPFLLDEHPDDGLLEAETWSC
jgi:hypothetical protein